MAPKRRAKRTRGDAERSLATILPSVARQTRRQLCWTQTRLAARADVSQPQVSRFEAALIDAVSLGEAGRLLDSLGIRLTVTADAPFVARHQRQHDAAHARCVAYTAGRLMSAGWEVRREAEIHQGRWHGWIDLLGFHAATKSGFIGEIKTELPDFGELERTLNWYTRMAWNIARSIGWQYRRLGSAVLVLATEANEMRLRDNAVLVRQVFPVRATALHDWLANPSGALPGPALVLIDPRSRRSQWPIALAADGRRSALRYANYADFMKRRNSR
jgi:transcriptional regulator with XRE-family HTH domain